MNSGLHAQCHRIGDNPNAILDQYLGGEELDDMILDEGNVFDNDLPQMTSRIVVFDGFQVRTFDVFLNNFKCILSCHF